MQGWPEEVEEDLKPYVTQQLELSIQDCYISWGKRVVIPPQAREAVLIELHGGHQRESQTKSVARRMVWWPWKDAEIESMVRRCQDCQQNQPSLPVTPLHPWHWPTQPWVRLHINFAGPLERKMFLVVIDAHFKRLEVSLLMSATSKTTIQQLRQRISLFGIPSFIVTDNSIQFSFVKFRNFCRNNGIHHFPISSYHPSSNGLAGRAVRIFKEGFRKMTAGTIRDRISQFLLQYHITPTLRWARVSPAELLIGYRFWTRLNLLNPDLVQKV